MGKVKKTILATSFLIALSSSEAPGHLSGPDSDFEFHLCEGGPGNEKESFRCFIPVHYKSVMFQTKVATKISVLDNVIIGNI